MQTAIERIAAASAPTSPMPHPPQPSLFLATTPQVVRQIFPATPLANIAANLPFILAALANANLDDPSMLLVALATIRAEAECFEPIAEAQSPFNTSPGGHPFDLYDHRRELGNLGPPDGSDFCGRGFVQLTGRANYTQYARATGHDLVSNPTLACEPAIAAELLARFLGNRESAIRRALAANDLAQARRLVNGGTNGLDRFTAAFRTGARLLASNPSRHQETA